MLSSRAFHFLYLLSRAFHFLYLIQERLLEFLSFFWALAQDYFESAFYFNGGLLASEYAGVTTNDKGGPGGNNRVSAYKIHGAKDPILFSDGFKLTWRVGDETDQQGLKCTCFPGGSTPCVPNGSPQVTQVLAQTWVYVWEN